MAWELRVSLTGQSEQIVSVDRGRLLIGTLLSNHVVLRAPDIEPIHAMIEELDDGSGWVIVDLGSTSGVLVNGQAVAVEHPIKVGDSITIADATIIVAESIPEIAQATMSPAAVNVDEVATEVASQASQHSAADAEPILSTGATTATRSTQVSSVRAEIDRRVEKRDILFAPRKAKPTGDVLECVAYWGDTVLEVDLFHPSFKGFESVSIGDTKNSHFISGAKNHVDRHVLAELRKDGFKVHLIEGMKARFRRGGSVEEKTSSGSYRLGRRDIVHISYGPIRYFILYVRPPRLNIPKVGPRDPFILGLSMVAALLYLTLVPFLWSSEMPEDLPELTDDQITIVNLPEKERPKPKIEKPKVKIAAVKKQPTRRPPPKPKPPKPKPAPPIKKKIEKPKPVPKPKPKPVTRSVKKPQTPKPQKQNLNQLSQGMASTGAKKPDFVASGAKSNGKVGPSGGSRGGGNRSAGAARKGKSKASVKGVEGVKNKKASGINLEKLGVGVGKILTKTSSSAISTNFKTSRGGGGGGSGSAGKTYGIAGQGTKNSLGLSGTSGAINNFGSGTGGFMSGKGGKGGLDGAGLGRGRGGPDRSLNIYIPDQEPLVSGGLTQNEVYMVIKTHLDQIKHCYERLLQRSPRSQGKIATAFVIGTDGRVSNSRIKSSEISDRVMQSCITEKIKRWKFPRPRGGESVNVTYPFVFAPRNS